MGVHKVVLKSDKIPLDLYYLEVFALNGCSQVNFWNFVIVFLHWILLMIMSSMSTCLGIVHGCAQSCAEKGTKYL
jgi:hypothetical protein